MSVQQPFWRQEIEPRAFARAVRHFAAWYRARLLALFPDRVAAWLADDGARKLAIIVREDGGECRWLGRGAILDAARWGPGPAAAEGLAAFTIAHNIDLTATQVNLHAPISHFFTRRFDAPAAALKNLPRLLDNEIERKTPFSPAEVWHGASVVPLNPDRSKFRIEHCIIRRDIVARICADLDIAVGQAQSIQPTAEDGRPDRPVIALTTQAARLRRSPTFLVALAAITVAGCLLGASGTIWRLREANEALSAETATASSKAVQVRGIADEAQREQAVLDTLRTEAGRFPSVAAIWEEVTRILQDDCWLTELRIAENKPGERSLIITGLANSAADLVAQIDRSPLFSDAVLTSAITPDPVERRERFSLQARIAPGKGEAGR